MKIMNQVRDLSEISSGGEGAETDERRLRKGRGHEKRAVKRGRVM